MPDPSSGISGWVQTLGQMVANVLKQFTPTVVTIPTTPTPVTYIAPNGLSGDPKFGIKNPRPQEIQYIDNNGNIGLCIAIVGDPYTRPGWNQFIGGAGYQMTVTGESANYLTCTYNCPGNPLNGTTTQVAKPPPFRGYSSGTGTNAGIYPTYTGATIYAIKPLGGTGVLDGSTPVLLQDVTPGRVYIGTQLTFCQSGVTYTAYFVATTPTT